MADKTCNGVGKGQKIKKKKYRIYQNIKTNKLKRNECSNKYGQSTDSEIRKTVQKVTKSKMLSQLR